MSSANSTSPIDSATDTSSSPATDDNPTTTPTPPPATSTTTTTPPPPDPTTSTTTPPDTSTSTSSEPPISTPTPTPTTTTSTPPPPPPSSTTTTTTTSTSNPPPDSSTPPTDPGTLPSSPSESQSTSTATEYVTTTAIPTRSSTSSTPSPSNTSGFIKGGDGDSHSLTQSSTIAVAVVVPIAAVALIVLAGLFFWRRRKQRKMAEEERRKEVEDYAYNPNNDPTLPNVAGAPGAYEMKEDSSIGYRGWGSTTLAGSTARKASTMSGGATGVAYSDGPSPTGLSDTRSGEHLMGDESHEGEILGAMGPSSADNRGGNVHRGPSNASSSYSAAGRSDGSGENPLYAGPGYYEPHGNSNNPYSDPYTDNPNGPVQPIIRDNPARRNTRIENPSHFPQQSAGISQNF